MKALALAAIAALTCAAGADFSGQTILGPLVNGDTVAGNNTGSSDDNDGWFSGMHIFDIWDGGDDVWALNWTGGSMHIELSYDAFDGDPDLFLYTPDNLDESSYDSFTNGLDVITVANAPAGTYYILVDSAAGSEARYSLAVTPAPAGVALLGLAALGRRRRT